MALVKGRLCNIQVEEDNMANTISKKARIWHRYLGFFLAGIMAVYAISGVVLIYRNTDFLKRDIEINKTIETKIPKTQLGQKLRIKNLKVTSEKDGVYYFKNGQYHVETGVVTYTKKELPNLLKKMTSMHKATTNSPLYFLNIFFGVALLFFSLSAFVMFKPNTSIFKKSMYFTLGGIILTLVLIFI